MNDLLSVILFTVTKIMNIDPLSFGALFDKRFVKDNTFLFISINKTLSIFLNY